MSDTAKARSRAFKFNFTTFTEDTEAWLQQLDCRYIVYGYELAPDTGRPHLEGYVVYDNARSLKGARREFHDHGKGYFDVAKGTPDQNYDYSTKDGQFFEKGERPISAQRKGEKERERFATARIAAKEGRFDDIPPDIYVRYQASLKRIHKEDRPRPGDLIGDENLVVGLWIYGPPGTGKSRWVREHHPGAYDKALNKWWDQYEDEQVIHMEDFAPEHAKFLTGYVKRWVDRYAFRGETKNGTGVFRPQRVIVTSNYTIAECFDGVDKEAILRRFEVMHFTGEQENQPPIGGAEGGVPL